MSPTHAAYSDIRNVESSFKESAKVNPLTKETLPLNDSGSLESAVNQVSRIKLIKPKIASVKV